MGTVQTEEEEKGKRGRARVLRGHSGNGPAGGLPEDDLGSWWEENSALWESKAKGRTGEPGSQTQWVSHFQELVLNWHRMASSVPAVAAAPGDYVMAQGVKIQTRSHHFIILSLGE